VKLTQSQLRKLIREELSGIVSEDSASDQMAVDKVREVVELWNESYNKLPDDESRALFEDFLSQNLKLYTERWQQERAEALNEAADPQQALLPDELKNKWMDMNAEVVGIMASLGIHDMRPSAFLEMVAAGQALLNAWEVSPEDLQLMIKYGKTLYSRTDATAED